MTSKTDIKRLYRSRNDYVFAGVAGGIAEYFEIDPTLVRVLLFLALLSAGPFGLLAYLFLAMVIPATPLEGTTPDR